MNSAPLSVTFYCADQNPHRDRSLGITSYTQGLLSELQGRPEIALSAMISRTSFAPAAGIAATVLPFATDNMVGRLLADHLHPLAGRSQQSRIWHYPKGFLPLLARVPGPVVATIHDTILQYYADHYPGTRNPLDFAYWLHVLKRSIARADLLLTVSEFSRRAILQFAERHKLACPGIDVTFQGSRFEEAGLCDGASKGDYVLHLASPLLHKRTGWLLATWQQLQRAGRELPELRMVGTVDQSSAEVLTKLRRVTLSGALQSHALAELIAKARALIFPSEVEGFGLPAVEAYVLGTPVVFVAKTAVAEILSDEVPGAFVFEVASFEHALKEVLNLPAPEVRRHGERLRQSYAWADCATRTLQAYRRLL